MADETPVDEVQPRTMGDLNKKRLRDKAQVEADVAAAAELDKKIADDKAKADASTDLFAEKLVQKGDFFDLNPDGTATAYFKSSGEEKFTTETLKPASTPLDDTPVTDPIPPTDPTVPPPVDTAPPDHPAPPVDETPEPPADTPPPVEGVNIIGQP